MADERIGLALDLGPSAASTRELAAALQTVQAVAHQGAAPALKEVDAAAGGVAARSGDMGRGILQASYAVQDFTSVLSGGGGLARALGSVQNNIPVLLAGLGMGGGLAGAISLVSVGAGVLFTNWDKISELWGKGGTEAEAKRMKELAEETKKAQEAAEKLLASPSKEQKQPGANIQGAIGQFGGPAVRKAIEDALVNARGDFGPAANKQFTEDLVNNVLRGDQPGANTLLRDIMRGRGGPVNRAIRGENPFGKDTGTGLTPAEQARRDKAVEDRRKAELAAAEGMNRDIELSEQQTAARKATEAGKFGRAAKKDLDAKAKATGGELDKLGSQDAKARQEIARLQEDAHQAKMQLGQGLATFEATQNTVARDQALIAQLQQQLRRIEQRERELQGRQTLLQRGR